MLSLHPDALQQMMSVSCRVERKCQRFCCYYVRVSSLEFSHLFVFCCKIWQSFIVSIVAFLLFTEIVYMIMRDANAYKRSTVYVFPVVCSYH